MANLNVRHFRTPEDFAGYISKLTAPKWFTKVAMHHTVSPTVRSWRGLPTMNGMINYYHGLGWSSYPHLYVAPDGIWQMNDVTRKGTATNAANSFSISIEVVGNYDNGVWLDPIYSYALDTITILQKWRGLKQSDIVLHRTYNPIKTCPGRMITWDWIQSALDNHSKPEGILFRVKYDHSRIRQGPSTNYDEAGKLWAGDTFISVAIKDDEYKDIINGETTWAHVTRAIDTKEQVDNLGFVHSSLIERI